MEGDFYGLLQTKGVEQYLHWLVMVMNGLNGSDEYDGDFTTILTPDIDYVQKLLDTHNTVHR